MRIDTPDEQGWYWCEDHKGKWFMAFVDTAEETVAFWDGHDPIHPPLCCDFDSAICAGVARWFGPFACPGGDFHENTVVTDAPLHEQAAAEQKAIVLVHVDFRHCADSHGSRLTMTSVQPRDDAEKYIYKEVEDMKREAATKPTPAG